MQQNLLFSNISGFVWSERDLSPGSVSKQQMVALIKLSQLNPLARISFNIMYGA